METLSRSDVFYIWPWKITTKVNEYTQELHWQLADTKARKISRNTFRSDILSDLSN